MPNIGDRVEKSGIDCISIKAQKILARRKSRLRKFFDPEIVAANAPGETSQPDGAVSPKSPGGTAEIPILVLESTKPGDGQKVLYSEKSMK